jgi:hypothetical protein
MLGGDADHLQAVPKCLEGFDVPDVACGGDQPEAMQMHEFAIVVAKGPVASRVATRIIAFHQEAPHRLQTLGDHQTKLLRRGIGVVINRVMAVAHSDDF